MFQNLKDKFNSAVRGDGSSNRVQTLQNMGFNADQARSALQATNNDVERAAELLIASSSSLPPPPTVSHQLNDDEEMRRVMQISLQIEEDRRVQVAQAASTLTSTHQTQTRTTAIVRAGEAASRRHETYQRKWSSNRTKGAAGTARNPTAITTKQKCATTTTTTTTKRTPAPAVVVDLSKHHPNIKIPTNLEDKSKEEQVLRCTDRLKSYPAAVDTLYRALVSLRDNPSNVKFRKIDKSTAGYQRSLADAPGSEGLLLAMNFHLRHGTGTQQLLVIEKNRVDPALLYLGISALECAQDTIEYKEAKSKIEFEKDVKAIQIMASNSSETEGIQRAAYISECPSEPTPARGALMQVRIANETVRRRFDGDDVLNDVLNWIGGHGSIIPDKILSREWCMVDLNRYPVAPIDCATNKGKTLQYIGCWPSGILEIRPSSDEWKQHGYNGDIEMMGSSRGLGSGPTEVLRR